MHVLNTYSDTVIAALLKQYFIC